jgi:hypothetical protein
MVHSEFEAQKKEFTKYAILSSQVTAAVILMVWVSLQNWLVRSKIFITVMISASLFVLSRLNYFGFFLDDIHPNSSRYLNLNMILFTSLISGGTLMVKESFGRLFTKQQHHYFLALFGCSLMPSFGLLIDIQWMEKPLPEVSYEEITSENYVHHKIMYRKIGYTKKQINDYVHVQDLRGTPNVVSLTEYLVEGIHGEYPGDKEKIINRILSNPNKVLKSVLDVDTFLNTDEEYFIQNTNRI